MTFPLVLNVFEPDWLGAARPHGRVDVFNHIWNYWMFASGHLLSGGGDLAHTDLLFYPAGFDLAFHTLDFIQIALVRVLSWPAGWVAGFNLTGIVLLVGTAVGAHALALHLTGSEPSAWLAGTAMAFNSWNLFHLNLHPDLMTLAGLPVAVLGVIRALDSSRSLAWGLVAGAAIAFSAFSGLYLLVVSAMTVVAVLLAAGGRRSGWRGRRYWATWLVVVGSGAALSAPRLAPMITNFSDLDEVVVQKYAEDSSVDLARLALPYGNPLFGRRNPGSELRGPDFSTSVPLVPMALALVGVWIGSRRRQARAWLGMTFVFATLTLGSTLAVGGHEWPAVPMPRNWLAEVIPVPFAAFRDSKLFFPGALLSIAVGSGIGLEALSGKLRSVRARRAVWFAAISGTLAGSWLGEFRPVGLEVSDFYRRLAVEPGRFALVELPFGRRPSKRYLYFQTIHHHPIQEGSVSRAPSTARAFIDGNPLLGRWEGASRGEFSGLNCSDLSRAEAAAAASSLRAAGFRYVVLHSDAPAGLSRYFAGVPSVFKDEELEAFRVDELVKRGPCVGDSVATALPEPGAPGDWKADPPATTVSSGGPGPVS